MTYDELKTAIQDYCQNSETTFVAHLDDFIKAAEDRIFLVVQMPAFWKSDSSLVTADGTSEYVVADGSIDVFSVRVGEAVVAGATAVDKGPVRYLIRKGYDFLLEAFPGTSGAAATGVPKYYAVSSAQGTGSAGAKEPTVTVRLGPIPGDIYPVTVDYYGKTSSDSITNGGTGTNETWLSLTSPDTLLYGSLVEAYTFMKGDPGLIQHYQTVFERGVGLVKGMGEGRQNDDGYIDGTKRAPAQ
jgi:hypothetical protein